MDSAGEMESEEHMDTSELPEIPDKSSRMETLADFTDTRQIVQAPEEDHEKITENVPGFQMGKVQELLTASADKNGNNSDPEKADNTLVTNKSKDLEETSSKVSSDHQQLTSKAPETEQSEPHKHGETEKTSNLTDSTVLGINDSHNNPAQTILSASEEVCSKDKQICPSDLVSLKDNKEGNVNDASEDVLEKEKDADIELGMQTEKSENDVLSVKDANPNLKENLEITQNGSLNKATEEGLVIEKVNEKQSEPEIHTVEKVNDDSVPVIDGNHREGSVKPNEHTCTKPDEEDTNKNTNVNKDEDEVIFVSQTPGDENKKVATLFKCVRCGQFRASKADLNKHLLQEHKLIIVSKQKSVDCLFCSKKLDMKDFHQHLKSEHKVLLVKSKVQKSSASRSTPADTSTQKEDNSPKLIDLTSDDEEGTSTVSKTEGAGKSNDKTSTTKSSSGNSPKKFALLPSSLPVRKSPRAIKNLKYAEPDDSASEPEDADAFVDDDNDEDFDPNTTETSNKKKDPPKKSSASMIKLASPATKHIRLSVDPPKTTLAYSQSKVGGNGSGSNVISSQTVTSSEPPKQGVHINANHNETLKSLKVNQTVSLNGQLYKVAQSGTIKYLAPLGAIAKEIKTTSTVTLPPQVAPGQSPSALPSAAKLVITSTSNRVISAPQGTLLSNQPPIFLSSPSLQPGQTLYLQLSQGQVQNVVTPIVQQRLNPVAQPVFPQIVHPFIQPRPQVLPGVQQSSVQSTIQLTTQAGIQTAAGLQPVNAILVQPSPALSQAQSTPSSVNVEKAVHAISTPVTEKRTPLPGTHTDLAKQNVSEKIHIAAPKDVKSSNFHKNGGLFALEVCLDTDTQQGTEPKLEPRLTYMIQEKETVFEQVNEEEESVTEPVVESLDSEKSRTIVAAAIARGHITPNDLSSLCDKVFFECPKCYTCFPQYLLLCLHTKRCSKLAPSTSPEARVHAPLGVIKQFFNDPQSARNPGFIYCRFCRARIMTVHSSPVQLLHLSKHIEPRVTFNLLPNKQSGAKRSTCTSECTAKALEWIDYIVPPFTLENPPTSSKTGLLDQYVSTDFEQGAFKKKKKKKKKKNKYHGSDSDDELAGSRLSSLRAKSAPYIGSLRPKETGSNQSQKGNGNRSSYNMAGSKHGRTMMHSFKHVRSPNKRGSTLTAYIPMKAKHKDQARQDDGARQWSNGRTRSQHVHWRRQSRRYPARRDRDTSTPDDFTPDGSVIQISSDEDRAGADEVVGKTCEKSETKSDQAGEQPNESDDSYTLTEDDFSDYLKLIDGAEEVQIGLTKPPIPVSPKEQNDHGEAASDLVDYYGNDSESSLGCEPLIMEPEQVVCYFKNFSQNKMICQFRDCDTEVPRNIRAMLAHIRVHFQILVPLQLLAKCTSQIPRQSIPRPLCLTFSQVEAHFVIADMQEANLHLGEVQQVYTCKWKSCYRPRCYKKNILQHLLKHIFFTLISKDEYQGTAKSMSALSSSEEEGAVKKLRIVAMNKSGEKIALVITIPASQAGRPDSLKAAIKKSLANKPSVKLPPNVLNAIVSKFVKLPEDTARQDSLQGTTPASQTSLSESADTRNASVFLTQAELDGLRKKFPFLLAKLNLGGSCSQSTQESSDRDRTDDMRSRLAPLICRMRSLRAKAHVTEREKMKKLAMPSWKSLRRKSVPLWTIQSRVKKGDLSVIKRCPSKAQGIKRKGSILEEARVQPPKKKENTVITDEHDGKHVVLDTCQIPGPSLSAQNGNEGEQISSGAAEDKMLSEKSGEEGEERTGNEPNEDETKDEQSPMDTAGSDEKPTDAVESIAIGSEETAEDKTGSYSSRSPCEKPTDRIEPRKRKDDQLPMDTAESDDMPTDREGSLAVGNEETTTNSSAHKKPTDISKPNETEGEPMAIDTSKAEEKSSGEMDPNEMEGAKEVFPHEEHKVQDCNDLHKKEIQTHGSNQGATDTVVQEKTKDADLVDSNCSNLGYNEKALSNQKSFNKRTSFVSGLSATKIIKAFRFNKAHMKKRVQVPERGYGIGVFRCKMPQCNFFQVVMRKDDKLGVLETLAVHLRKAHFKKTQHRALVFYWNKEREASIPSSEFLEAFSDLPTGQDLTKIKLTDKFQRIPRNRVRLAGVGARRARLKVLKFLKCASSGCLFGSCNPSRQTLISHLQKHLYRAQLKAAADAQDLEASSERGTASSQHNPEGTLASCPGPNGADAGSVSGTSLPETAGEDLQNAEQKDNSQCLDKSHGLEDFQLQDESQDDLLHSDEGHRGASHSPENKKVQTPDPSEGDIGSPLPAAVTEASEQAQRSTSAGVEANGVMDPSQDDTNSRPDGGHQEQPMELDSRGPSPQTIEGEMHAEQMDCDISDDQEHGSKADTVPEAPPSDDMNKAEEMELGDGDVLAGPSGDEKSADNDVLALPSDSSSVPTKDMDELASQPGDTIKMFHDELQAYFTCYTNKISQTKEFGVKCFSCPKCNTKDLRGESLPKHLQSHVNKVVLVTSLDNISNDILPLEEKDHLDPGLRLGENNLNSLPNAKGSACTDQDDRAQTESSSKEYGHYEETEDTILITEEEMIRRFFVVNMNSNVDSPFPFRREFMKCKSCSYETMTIMDTPSHVEKHVKKTVILRK